MGRFILLTLSIGSVCWSQSMLEHAGIAAGSTVGSVAGKQVSNGITNILNKAAKTTESAAKDGKQATAATSSLLQVGPGTPKQAPYNVPPPPPLPQAKRPAPQPRPEPVIEVVEFKPPPPPPPPMMTAAN